MTPAAEPARELGPLTPDHLVQLRRAHRAARALRAGARFASFSGWTTLLFGLAAAPFALGSGVHLALAVALIAVGYHELALRRRLVRLDRSAPGALALNQALLAAIVIAYAAWHLLPTGTGPATALGAQMVTGDPAMDATLARVGALANLGVYAGLIAGTAVAQGVAMRFYLSRRKKLASFLAETPGWVLTLHREGVMG